MERTNEQIAAVLREVVRCMSRKGVITYDERDALLKGVEPQAAPQRCVECDGVGWIPGRGPDGEPDGERCQACKGAPKPAEPPKPRRMMASNWNPNCLCARCRYHNQEHNENEECGLSYNCQLLRRQC